MIKGKKEERRWSSYLHMYSSLMKGKKVMKEEVAQWPTYILFLPRLRFLAHNASSKRQNQPSQVSLECSISIMYECIHMNVFHMNSYVCIHMNTCSCLVAKSCPTLFATPWTVARQVPLSMGFPRQEYWSGFHLLLKGIFPTCTGKQILYHWAIRESWPYTSPI